MIKWLLWLCLFASTSFGQQLTQAEYFIGSDPGEGLGTSISVPLPSDLLELGWTIVTDELGSGVHQVSVRAQDSTGVWSMATSAALFVQTISVTERNITACEYQIDNGPFTPVDIPDSTSATFGVVVPTAGLSDGVHHFRSRCSDDQGIIGALSSADFFVLALSQVVRQITDVEYWLDNQPPTSVDVADASSVDWADVISTNGLSDGVHHFNMRARDDLGRVGATSGVPLFVLTLSAQARTITGAEFWVNEDPGPGNGIPIHFPLDGQWDEGEETPDTAITGLPVGLHRIGFRAQDDLGHWSMSMFDTLAVGPLVVIQATSGNIQLDWQSGPGVAQFYIYESTTPTGVFTLQDSTASQSYTVSSVAAAPEKQFYHITFRSESFSTFRMPEAVSANAVR